MAYFSGLRICHELCRNSCRSKWGKKQQHRQQWIITANCIETKSASFCAKRQKKRKQEKWLIYGNFFGACAPFDALTLFFFLFTIAAAVVVVYLDLLLSRMHAMKAGAKS